MFTLPVRVELKSDIDSSFCRFTIIDVEFHTPPAKNDTIDFHFDNWPIHVVAGVQSVYHCIGNKTGSVVCCSSSFVSQEQLIRAFDLFKDSMKICDLDVGGARPPVYYPAYRVVLRVWGKKVFSHVTDSPTILAEIMKAALMAADVTDLKVLVKSTELVHRLLLEHKQRVKDDYELMAFVRDWDRETQLAVEVGKASDYSVIINARQLLASFKSVPVEKWPIALTSTLNPGSSEQK